MIELSIRKKLNAASGEMLLKLDWQIEQGKLVTLYGKSGAGKTSTLRILAGLMQPDEGRIVIDGLSWLDTNKGINLRPQKRKVGFVFQDYALFPNMTVRDNLLFALEQGQDQKIVEELIEIVELGALQNRKPMTLSGGQKQRVALARALVQKPRLLMLDEPLSALDLDMRLKLQQYILQVHREYGLTTILISHDIAEILKMSDEVLVLDQGRIIRHGLATEVLIPELERRTLQFIGEIVELEKLENAFILSAGVGQQLLKIKISETEGQDLSIGDKIVFESETFNTFIRKLS